MFRFLFPLLIIISPFLPPGIIQGDFIADMSMFFKSGNSREIAKNFNSTVELSITNNGDVYSKAQAEQILRDFFVKHYATNATIVHQINTNPNLRFGILNLETRQGRYRVSITSKKANNAFLITELRIDPEK
ncbi:DUF4783 domain-containing protein [Pedobacter sp.]|uniref:DUF4783 domain-containing protein n=1 Tax=Pedobacter sp. TaxID=1411316 RepID=UPI003D7FCDBF